MSPCPSRKCDSSTEQSLTLHDNNVLVKKKFPTNSRVNRRVGLWLPGGISTYVLFMINSVLLIGTGEYVTCLRYHHNIRNHLLDLMYSGICLMWPPVGPHVQWNLSNVVTYGTLCTVEPV